MALLQSSIEFLTLGRCVCAYSLVNASKALSVLSMLELQVRAIKLLKVVLGLCRTGATGVYRRVFLGG